MTTGPAFYPDDPAAKAKRDFDAAHHDTENPDPVHAIERALVNHAEDRISTEHLRDVLTSLLIPLRDLQARANPAAETPPSADQVALDRADDLARLCSRALDLREQPLAYDVMRETVAAYYERRPARPDPADALHAADRLAAQISRIVSAAMINPHAAKNPELRRTLELLRLYNEARPNNAQDTNTPKRNK